MLNPHFRVLSGRARRELQIVSATPVPVPEMPCIGRTKYRKNNRLYKCSMVSARSYYIALQTRMFVAATICSGLAMTRECSLRDNAKPHWRRMRKTEHVTESRTAECPLSLISEEHRMMNRLAGCGRFLPHGPQHHRMLRQGPPNGKNRPEGNIRASSLKHHLTPGPTRFELPFRAPCEICFLCQ